MRHVLRQPSSIRGSTQQLRAASACALVPLPAAVALLKGHSNILGRQKLETTGTAGASGYVPTEHLPSKLLSDWRPWVAGSEHRTELHTGLSNSSEDAGDMKFRTARGGARAPGSTDLAVSSSQVAEGRFMGIVEDMSVGFTDALIAREKFVGVPKPSPTDLEGTPAARVAKSKKQPVPQGGPYTAPVLRMVLSLMGEGRVVVLSPLSASTCRTFASPTDAAPNSIAKDALLAYVNASTGVEVGCRVIVSGALRSVVRVSEGRGGGVAMRTVFLELPRDGVWTGAVTSV